MPRRSQIKTHVNRDLIEVSLALKVPLAEIAERYGVSIFSASRHRVFLKNENKERWHALRRALRERGITKKVFMTRQNGEANV